MKPILIVLTLGLLVAFSGCIQPQSGPQVKEAVASEAWKPDGIVGANEYARSMHLREPGSSGYSGGDLEISWKNDAQFLYLVFRFQNNIAIFNTMYYNLISCHL